jgi:hypothetical protein
MHPHTEETVDAFHRASELMREIHVITAEISKLESSLDTKVAGILRDAGMEASLLTGKLATAEAELEKLCQANPHWFGTVKQIKTPWGVFKNHASSHLEIPDESGAVRKIRRRGLSRKLLRVSIVVNREAAELLTDDELSQLGIIRVREEKFSVTPAKVKAGKAAAAQAKVAGGADAGEVVS